MRNAVETSLKKKCNQRPKNDQTNVQERWKKGKRCNASATLGTMDFGGSVFWLLMKTRFLRDFGLRIVFWGGWLVSCHLMRYVWLSRHAGHHAWTGH